MNRTSFKKVMPFVVLEETKDNSKSLQDINISELELYLARDKDNSLYLYQGKPIKYSDVFREVLGNQVLSVPNELYPEVTFDNSPKRIKLTIE
jgi:hypothetical protein